MRHEKISSWFTGALDLPTVSVSHVFSFAFCAGGLILNKLSPVLRLWQHRVLPSFSPAADPELLRPRVSLLGQGVVCRSRGRDCKLQHTGTLS